jgi:hypothetical protein
LIRSNGGVAINTNTLIANAALTVEGSASVSGAFAVNGTPSDLNGPADDMVIRARNAPADANVDLAFFTRSGRVSNFILSDTTGTLAINVFDFTPGSPRINAMGATLSGGGVWTNQSSRFLKQGFTAVDPLAVLSKVAALPITTWTYKDSAEGTHMGPVAEDFKAAFGLAGDGKSIGTVDADGVALAAIQGLNIKLERENAELRARLEAIEKRLGSQ